MTNNYESFAAISAGRKDLRFRWDNRQVDLRHKPVQENMQPDHQLFCAGRPVNLVLSANNVIPGRSTLELDHNYTCLPTSTAPVKVTLNFP